MVMVVHAFRGAREAHGYMAGDDATRRNDSGGVYSGGAAKDTTNPDALHYTVHKGNYLCLLRARV